MCVCVCVCVCVFVCVCVCFSKYDKQGIFTFYYLFRSAN